ncbi:MAG TPA: NADH-quinone oxidoreductase subunit L [Myxococcota bacterium]|nr:NADH-quinone oxidoreductase subunit L [Myxococcota bacterium]
MNEHLDPALRWIPLLPLAAAVISGLWLIFAPRHLPRALVILLAVGAPIASFAISVAQVLTLATSFDAPQMFLTDNLYTWISAGDFHAELSFLLDPLSAVMILVVTGVGSLIHVYSVGYMDDDHRDDRGFQRFFAYLNLFTFAMLMLVLGDNLLVMFVGWEGVGLCSYLLIGFWYLDDANAAAGQKAFVVNRIGDFGFLLGIFLLFWSFAAAGVPTIEFREMAANVNQLADKTVELAPFFSFLPGFPTWGLLTLACLLLFVGAAGKSAQIPLYVWLPDAMAGPTPVSALIHAATMVTAGVYMVCRMSFAYSLAPGAEATVAWTGAITALFAATIGLAQTDIKKVLAYSTVSQLGYMFLAAGVAGYSAAIFHVMTHAFFKALLFLGAGSVILGMHHEQDIMKMGGLRTRMPWTWLTFLVGVLAISGVPPFSGFFSKDEILLAANQAHDVPGHEWLWAIGVVTAGLTAFYMFRLYYLVFTGESRADHHTRDHVHESGNWILVPLVVLAVLSLLGGLVGLPDAYGELAGVPQSNSLHYFLQPVAASPAHHVDASVEFGLAALTTGVGLAGIAFATLFYYWRRDIPAQLAGAIRPLYELVRDKYRIDELYDAVIVRPIVVLSKGLLADGLDQTLIDGVGVNGVARFFRGLADGALKYLQTGFAQSYLFAMLLGGALLIAWLVRGA